MRAAALLLTLLLALPASAQPRNRAADIDALAAALKLAPNEEVAAQLESRLRTLWTQSASPAALLLMNRGMREISNNAADEAVQDCDAAVTLEPALPEAFHRRALARAAAGDYAGALADIQQTLKLEPRHFAALQSLSRIAEDREDWKGALAAWKKSLELSPHSPDGADRLKMLELKVYGQGT